MKAMPIVRRAQNGLQNDQSTSGARSTRSRQLELDLERLESRSISMTAFVRRLTGSFGLKSGSRSRGKRATKRGVALNVQIVETRVLLAAHVVDHTTVDVVHHHAGVSPSGNGYTPSQILTAYGFNNVSFSNGPNGTGQTIAIVDAYNDPTIAADLQAFDRALGLANPPSLTVMSQTGSTTNLPPTDPGAKSNDWEVEEALDVEWAHALAPGANIVLVEANSANESDLMTAVKTAANLPGVSVVSMSWGGSEFSSESAYDSYFTTPAGHQGVTFVASTGDNAAPAGYPAYSPNVLAVGGTTLTINSSGQYVSESGWAYSGGGISSFESQPTYQSGFVKQSSTRRAAPDVAFDADPNSGVPIYDSFSFGTNGWIQVGGTSFSAPAWAAIIATANQGRVLNGEGTLNGTTQTLPMLYSLDKSNPSAFHDVTSGNNGYAASTGYDLVTGLGSPVVNQVVSGLVGSTQSSTAQLVFQQVPTSATAGAALGTIKVAVENSSGQLLTSDNSTVTIAVNSGPANFAAGSTVTAQVVNGIATFSNLTLNTVGAYTLRASDGSDTVAVSGTVTITAAQANKLVYQQVPSSGTAGSALGTIKVAVENSSGQILTSDNSTVTLAVNTGPGGFAAGSTVSAQAVNGIATFSNVILNTAGSYTVRASDGSDTAATSGSLTISAAQASKVVFQQTPSAGSVGTALGTVTVAIEDQFGNLVTSNSSTVTLAVASGPGSLAGTTTATVVNGLATFSNLSLTTAGTYTLRATDGTLTSATSGTITITGGGGGLGLSAPQASVMAVNSTTAQLNWTTVSGATGYRIYQIVSGQSVLLGSVSAATSSAKITNLVAGSTASFVVEAYNSTSVADSAIVSVTLPTSQTLSAPVVHGTAASTTAAQLSWGAVTGAQGYRVYIWSGGQAVLLGTVSASTTNVRVTQLSPGHTYQFLVEAYNGATVADSSWVTVTMPFSFLRQHASPHIVVHG
jgi:subtilase family serine protease